MPPDAPGGAQFLLNAIASLHGEIAAQLDAHKAKDARIAELEAKVAELEKPPE